MLLVRRFLNGLCSGGNSHLAIRDHFAYFKETDETGHAFIYKCLGNQFSIMMKFHYLIEYFSTKIIFLFVCSKKIKVLNLFYRFPRVFLSRHFSFIFDELNLTFFLCYI